MKAIKLEVFVLDFDGIGVDGVIEAIEGARYPNRCIDPQIKGFESVDIEWSDDHPLNKHDTSAQAYLELFTGNFNN